MDRKDVAETAEAAASRPRRNTRARERRVAARIASLLAERAPNTRAAIHVRAVARRRTVSRAIHNRGALSLTFVLRALAHTFGVAPSTIRSIHDAHCRCKSKVEVV